jgi:hypothetical protein
MGMGAAPNALASLTPQQQQQLLMMMQQRQQQAAPQTGQGQVPGGGQSAGQGQQPPQMSQMPSQQSQQMAQFQTGRSTMQLPSGTVSPAVPGVPYSATPPNSKPSGGGGTTMRATGLVAAVMAVKQSQSQNKMQKARQLTSQYLALKQNGDPQVQKTADAMMQDPKVHKIFDKAINDPSSPEYQGVQMAYRDIEDQEQRQKQMQEMQSKIESQSALSQQRLSLAQQESAYAERAKTQASQMGQVTPAEQAKLDEKMKQATIQIQGRLDQTQMQTSTMLKVVDARVSAMRDVARINAGAKLGAAGMRQQAASQAIFKEYKALQDQANELDRQSKDLKAHLDKNTHWYGDADDADEVQGQLMQIETKKAVLAQQFQMLQQKDQLFQRQGVIPMGAGDGTKEHPIVIQ